MVSSDSETKEIPSPEHVSCIHKQEEMKALFSSCKTKEALYQAIIDLGKEQKEISASFKDDDHLVPGCQSKMYLRAELIDGVCLFETESDALISAGLGQLLVRVYSGEKPEALFQCPPTYLQELGIPASLTPGRANGLASLYHKMKQHALHWIVQLQKQCGA